MTLTGRTAELFFVTWRSIGGCPVREFLAVAKALSDETRLRALLALSDHELCLCQLVDLFGLAPSTVSKHINILCDAGLVLRRKEGRWAYFRLSGRGASRVARQALRWAAASLSEEPQIRRDGQTLNALVEKDLEKLCECYSQG
jgi:ArsR family transcriptional regulator